MSQSNVEVPPAVPVAAPAAAPVAGAPAPVAVAPAPAAQPAPAAIQPPPLVTPPAPVAKTEPQPGDPAWIAARLASDRAARLREFGFESEEEAKAAAASIKAQKDSQKTLEQRLAERDAELTQTKTRAEQLEATHKEVAARMMFGLTDGQKAAVTAVAGEDAAAQIKAIHALTPTWAKETAAATAAAGAAPVAAVPVPAATTAPGRNAPAGNESSPPNHAAIYAELSQSNPFKAAQYGLAHPESYKPTA